MDIIFQKTKFLTAKNPVARPLRVEYQGACYI